MAGSVIERHGHSIDESGRIRHDDRPVTWEVADERAGRRLDRRRSYAFIDGKLCETVRWSGICSACSYDTDYGSEQGGGCEECGYHGVVRQCAWVPAELAHPRHKEK